MSPQRMHSPNAHQHQPPPNHIMNNPMMMGSPGPRMNGPMGNPMGSHMMQNPNGPMHGIAAPMHSPMNNMNSPMPGPMSGVGNGPMSGPVGSPMTGPMNGPPMNNGPIPQMNMNTPNGPIGTNYTVLVRNATCIPFIPSKYK